MQRRAAIWKTNFRECSGVTEVPKRLNERWDDCCPSGFNMRQPFYVLHRQSRGRRYLFCNHPMINMPLTILSIAVLLAWIVALANNTISRSIGSLSAASAAVCFWTMMSALASMRKSAELLSASGMSDPRQLADSVASHLLTLTYGGIAAVAYLIAAAIAVSQWSRPGKAEKAKP